MRIPFFGRRKIAAASGEQPEAKRCPHLILVPTWDNSEDMGNEAKATGYRCYACANALTLTEAGDARRRGASVM